MIGKYSTPSIFLVQQPPKYLRVFLGMMRNTVQTYRRTVSIPR
jgi:hypothetical protein